LLKKSNLEVNTKSNGWRVVELRPFEVRTSDIRHRTPDTGHVKWFYIMSNAAMHCIGWLDRQKQQRKWVGGRWCSTVRRLCCQQLQRQSRAVDWTGGLLAYWVQRCSTAGYYGA